jgi:F-box/WD-40 domain protein 7
MLSSHRNYVRALFVAKNGQVLSASADKTVKVWDTETGNCIRTLNGHDDYALVVAMSDSGTIISGGWDKKLLYGIKIMLIFSYDI